jgi:copper transport protein
MQHQHRLVRTIILMAGLVLILFSGPAASAHAYLVDSTPRPGVRLGTAPGAVVLVFSETVDPRLSSVEVTAPDGGRFHGTASGRRVETPLTTNAPGVYRVQWKVVDEEDGHTVRGSFRFGVSVTSGAGSSRGDTVNGESLLLSVGRTVEYIALLFVAGVLLLRALAWRHPGLDWVPSARKRVRLGLTFAFIAGLAVVLGEVAAARGSVSVSSLGDYLRSGLSGGARLARLSGEGLAIASAGAGLLWLTGGLLVVTLVALAASGHAAAVHPAWMGIAVDSGHLITAGMWAGGILALAMLRPPGGWRGPEARSLLHRFSPVAVGAFVATLGFGAIQALQELGSLNAAWDTAYGKTLLAKMAAVLAMVPLSVLAWRRRLAPRAEAGMAVGVVLAASLLSILPVPAGGTVAAIRDEAAAFPREGDLTLGGDAGQFLIGLTVRPARPGPNTLTVYLFPVDGKVAGIPVEIDRGKRGTQMTPCGPTCRRARIVLNGGEELKVVVAGSRGGAAIFSIPRLPVANGVAVLARAQRRMHSLRTYRLSETLSSGLGPAISSRYAFEAPHRMAITTRGSQTTRTVWVGPTRYLQQRTGSRWQVQRGGPPPRVPSFIWDYFRPFVAPTMIGTSQVDGRLSRVISFFGRQGPTPVWFRLWIDAGGLVRKAQMRAQGHFMDHHYFDFDKPITIRPPIGTGGTG